MSNGSIKKLEIKLLLVVIGCFCALANTTLTANTTWTGLAADNLWTSTDNWNNGVPDVDADAIINGNAEAPETPQVVEITEGMAAESKVLRMAGDGNATINMTGGTYSPGGGEIGLGHTVMLNISGGEVTQRGYTQLGRISEAQLNISDGLWIAQNTLRLGGYAGGKGILNLSGGELRKVGDGNVQSGAGEAYFNVSGGLFDISGDFQPGWSTTAYYEINLSGGTLRTRGAANIGMAENGNQLGIVNIYDGAEWIAERELRPGYRGDTIMNMYGGTVTVGGVFTVAHGSACVNRWATGKFYMHGGTLTVNNTFYVGMWEGHPEVYLEGGTVTCNYLDIRNRPTAISVFDITGGTLVINGDHRAVIAGYIDNDLLTGYGTSKAVVVNYVGGQTIVTADLALLQQAQTPYPANYAGAINQSVTLTWEPGINVQSVGGHVLYFGSAYEDADESASPYAVLNTNNYALNGLELGQTYYWRVDQVDGDDVYTGSVWQFTVANYLVVDNFEQYGGVSISGSWQDGAGVAENGASVSLSMTPRSGDYAMQVNYDHTGSATYSEVTLDAAGSDWTQQDVKALTLFFRGNAANSPAPMYVKVSDGTATAMTTFADSNATTLTDWTTWNISLADVAAQGVNLSAVDSLTIGIEKASSGTGNVVIDDIRLYLPRCVPSEGPLADISGDCFVDVIDLILLAEGWLDTDMTIVGEAYTGAGGPMAYYTFDDVDASGWYAYDSSGNDYTAEIFGPQIVYDAERGNDVANFSIHQDTVVILDSSGESDFDLTEAITVAMWVKTQNSHSNARPFSKDLSYIIEFSGGGPGGVYWRCIDSGVPGDHIFGGSVPENEWTHIAGVFDITTSPGRMELYINGVLVAEAVPTSPLRVTNSIVTIGATHPNGSALQFYGLMDDVMIFDRGLSASEIVGLAVGVGESVYQPLDNPQLDLYEDGKIDLLDFSVLASEWLTEQLWP